jgi:hypothetical protein
MMETVVKAAEETVLKSKELIPYLWTIVSSLSIGIAVLFWRVFNGMERNIDRKVSKEVCSKEHEVIKSALHTHAEAGRAGEVVDR